MLFPLIAFAQPDVLGEIEFDEVESTFDDLDITVYLRDLTEDFAMIDEQWLEDSTLAAEEYNEVRKVLIQDLVNKPGVECYGKYQLNSLKSQTFSQISATGLNPYFNKLKDLNEVRRNAKKDLLAEVANEAYEMLDEEAKEADKDEVAHKVKLIRPLVKEQVLLYKDMINDSYYATETNLVNLKANESDANMKLKLMLGVVPATQVGNEECYKLVKQELPVKPVKEVETTTEYEYDSSGYNSDDYYYSVD